MFKLIILSQTGANKYQNTILEILLLSLPQFFSALFIILVGLKMTLFRDKMLISHRCIHGLMANLIKKSWTVSIASMSGQGI